MINVTATVIRDGRWWGVKIPDYDITGQAARLADAEAVAREITALWLEIPEDDISVTVIQVLNKDIEQTLREAAKKEKHARALMTHAAQMRSKAVCHLLDTGMAQGEAAKLLGISRQRVAQLAEKYR